MDKKSKYSHDSHSKHLLHAHLIFCVKYRKSLLLLYGNDIKDIFTEISHKYDFTIDTIEVDRDHIHMMIRFSPTVAMVSIVRRLKQISTNRLWRLYSSRLKNHFWAERTFWSDGYFVGTTGEASTETIRKYIESQG
jgi:putative transposase